MQSTRLGFGANMLHHWTILFPTPATHPPGLSQEEGSLIATSKKLKKSENKEGAKRTKRFFCFFFAITILSTPAKTDFFCRASCDSQVGRSSGAVGQTANPHVQKLCTICTTTNGDHNFCGPPLRISCQKQHWSPVWTFGNRSL